MVKCCLVSDSFTSNSSATIYIYTALVSDKTHLKSRDLALCSRNDGAAPIVHGLLHKDIFQVVYTQPQSFSKPVKQSMVPCFVLHFQLNPKLLHMQEK